MWFMSSGGQSRESLGDPICWFLGRALLSFWQGVWLGKGHFWPAAGLGCVLEGLLKWKIVRKYKPEILGGAVF